MARRFGVGQPTIREALKKLETMGFVQIRHGSGVFVTRSEEVLVLASPDYTGTVTKKLLLDLIRARDPARDAVRCRRVKNATPEDIVEMRAVLATAGQNLDNDEVLNSVNMGFHGKIARASGNTVTAQLLDVLHDLFTDEQRLILGIFGSREDDHMDHLAILEAIELRDEMLGVERMRRIWRACTRRSSAGTRRTIRSVIDRPSAPVRAVPVAPLGAWQHHHRAGAARVRDRRAARHARCARPASLTPLSLSAVVQL